MPDMVVNSIVSMVAALPMKVCKTWGKRLLITLGEEVVYEIGGQLEAIPSCQKNFGKEGQRR